MLKKVAYSLKFFILGFVVLGCTSSLLANQSNFSLLPAPIAYPYFEPERTDFKMGGVKWSLSSNNTDPNLNIDISGAGGYFIGRYAINEYVAFDGGLGIFGGSGEVPGFALPFIYGSSYGTPVIEGKGDLTGFGVPLMMNLEVQAIHKPLGSLIFFAGPNMSIMSLNLDTPYHAVITDIWGNSATAEKTTFNTKSTVVMGGVQVGAQAGINLGPFTVAPFYMLITQSGSANFTFDDGYQGTYEIQGTSTEIEPFLVKSTGADVVYRPWGLSIGALIQSAGSTTNQEGYTTKYIQLTWHFRTK